MDERFVAGVLEWKCPMEVEGMDVGRRLGLVFHRVLMTIAATIVGTVVIMHGIVHVAGAAGSYMHIYTNVCVFGMESLRL